MLHPFEPNELDLYVDMYYEIFTSPTWGYGWLKREDVKRYFYDIVQTPKFLGFTYWKEQQLVGCCLGTISDYFLHPQYYIKEIFIQLNKQRDSLGSLMMKEIENELMSRGVSNIFLLTSKDIPAYPFYMKNGYHVSDNLVYMTKYFKP